MQSNTGLLQPKTRGDIVLDFQIATNSVVPFGRSLQLILEAVAGQAGADVACLYIYQFHRLKSVVRTGKLRRSIDSAQITLTESASEWLQHLCSVAEISEVPSDWRVSSFPEVILNGLKRLVVAPLRTDEQLAGILTAGWKINDGNEDAGRVIDALSASATQLLAQSHHAEAAGQIAAEMVQLEAELADLKIADRANEILTRQDQAEQTAFMVHQHVQRVLEGTHLSSVLRQQLDALRAQVHDRKLVNRAKAFLQQTRRMSEEEAYLHLRNSSRRERRPLREVANEILC